MIPDYNRRMRSRPNAISSKAVVTSSSIQASAAGADILRNGGNIVDAAIATSAVLSVTQNNLCGLGGDLFALIRMDGKGIFDLNGSGRSAETASIDHFRSLGMNQIPWRGKHSAFTVPGIVDAWNTMHRRFGTMEFSDLLKPAIALAENGVPLTHNYVNSVAVTSRYLSEYEGWKKIFNPGGSVPQPGFILKQKDLGATLSRIAEDGPDSFYRGYLADKVTEVLSLHDSMLTSEDFRRHSSMLVKPLFTSYRGYDIYETGPNSQGAATILWLNILEEIEKGRAINSEEEELKLLLESGFLSYTRRNLITDPEFHPLPDDFASKSYARKLLDSRDSVELGSKENSDPGDTTYFTLSDSEGNTASVIQSNYMGFGSGIVPDGFGFVMQNRGCYFTLDENHPNALEPKKRTFHTLCAAMGERDGEAAFSLGTMGGDIQPQIQMELLWNILVHGDDPQLALDKPRWAFPASIYEKPSGIIAESELFSSISGYKWIPVRVEDAGKWTSRTGHAQIIRHYENRTVFGGADPRGDGVAIPL